jgi:Xaa-Pro aminopeptidase
MPISQILQDAREHMRSAGFGGWLLYDYHNANPILWDTVGHVPNVTRPCWLWVPTEGEAHLLVSYVDEGRFAHLGLPSTTFVSRDQMVAGLKALLPPGGTVAMEYSPSSELPRISRVDAGTLELVRSLDVGVVSSADIVQYATQRWDNNKLASHVAAAEKLTDIVKRAFRHIRETLTNGITEYEVAEFIRNLYKAEGLETPDGPVVAANQHSSDPHFDPTETDSAVITEGDWVLIDLWARLHGSDTMYADITWTGYVGETVPQRQQSIFDTVIGARDTGLAEIVDAAAAGRPLQGWQVDRVARDFVNRAGYGEQFSHRLGHSLGREVHSTAVNLDDWETHDTRLLIPRLAVTIEPGIYLPDFGVRSEIDVFIGEDGPRVTTEIQTEVFLI